MKKLKKMNANGFTLIEMVLVLFVISILMLLIIPNIVTQKQRVDTKGTEALVTVVQTQVELYEMEFGEKPTSFELLEGEKYLSETQVEQANTKLQIIDGVVSVKKVIP
ncbi:MAG: prepilin-type N-terminal cleavage/methylation domain-containing protein [Carnobacterium sp.]|nr:prepilin-type N-terminal cleavage/methylation domain-containing protein [Carnobacterium sp.]